MRYSKSLQVDVSIIFCAKLRNRLQSFSFGEKNSQRKAIQQISMIPRSQVMTEHCVTASGASEPKRHSLWYRTGIVGCYQRSTLMQISSWSCLEVSGWSECSKQASVSEERPSAGSTAVWTPKIYSSTNITVAFRFFWFIMRSRQMFGTYEDI